MSLSSAVSKSKASKKPSGAGGKQLKDGLKSSGSRQQPVNSSREQV
jgi:hypothetical protein